MNEHRPNPDQLLKRIKEEERQEKSGKLKIYLGAAPGVGKTFTMLQDAISKRSKGLDVVVGIVESHGRQEVENLLQNFEILPKQVIQYREKKLSEFDLDGALKRNPALILVDEMAHKNVSGLRHAKRWQDIKELLDRGIDVYTTLNIQHIESLNDVVSQIIHAHIKETVPDSMLELADTVELVDLAPEDLLKRLQEGKVYFPKQAELAKEHFFRKGNLTALRELALRTTAERVSAQVLLYRQGQGIQHIWPTKEKILVCVGPGTEATKLIRTARRIAMNLHTEWIAVYVDVPQMSLSEKKRNRAIQNLQLVEQLGGQTRILLGTDIVKEIIHFAREQNISRILIGKKSKITWKNRLFGTLLNKFIQQSGEIDIHAITEETFSTETIKERPEKKTISWRFYSIAILAVIIASLVNLALYPYMHTSSLILLYLLAVTIVAAYGQTFPSILTSILSVFAYDFLFIPPFFTCSIRNFQDVATLTTMLLVALIVSNLTITARKQTESARFAENQTADLHTLSRKLSSTRGTDKLLDVGIHYITDMFDSDVMALLPENDTLKIRASTGRTKEKKLSPKEQSVAQWVYDLGQVAGLGTDTLPFSEALYVPLLASQGVMGVLRIHPFLPNHLFSPEQMHLLERCATQLSLALEVDKLQEKARKSELKHETDRVRNALLQDISHDLRTPIISAMGTASTLMEMSGRLNAEKVKQLGKNIYSELDQLNRLINNLLQITYLEAESVKLQKQFYSLPELIKNVVKTLSNKLDKRAIHLQVPENFPDVPFDHVFLEEVFINLLDNAIKFTQPGSSIDISLEVEKNKVIVSIEDHGPGIMADEVNKLFEKFYRGRQLTTERGLGLGLAICRSIIKAHGGDIWAENRDGGGAVFRFTLPLSLTA